MLLSHPAAEGDLSTSLLSEQQGSSLIEWSADAELSAHCVSLAPETTDAVAAAPPPPLWSLSLSLSSSPCTDFLSTSESQPQNFNGRWASCETADESAAVLADRRTPQSVSFGGGALLGMYGVGAATAVREFGHPFSHYGGASIGSLTALSVASELCLIQARTNVEGFLIDIRKRPLWSLCSGATLIRKFIDQNISPEGIAKAHGRFFCSVTSVSLWPPSIQGRVLSEFVDEQHVTEAIVASCHLPGLMGILPAYIQHNGVWCVDGGFMEDIPKIHEDTLTISPLPNLPFLKRADITPSSFLWPHYMVVPANSEMQDHFWECGYEDTMSYMQDNF